MSISLYSSDHSAASQPLSHEFSHSNPSRPVGHGSARRSRDVCDRARRRFVSSRSRTDGPIRHASMLHARSYEYDYDPSIVEASRALCMTS
eukprot:scaffold20395_cov128-Isochrysis_galbana.AAC.2